MGSLADGYKSLRHIAASLGAGETRNGLRCPFCGGGNGRENSLCVSRKTESEALFICFRASCGRSGKITANGFRLTNETVPSSSPIKQTSFTPRIYPYATQRLGASWTTHLLERFGITEGETTREGWSESIKNGELVIPVCNRRKVRIGTEARKPDGYLASGPKVRFYKTQDGVFQNWYNVSKGVPTVLVEDSISALKVSRSFMVAALLGTHLNFERLSEALEGGPEIVIALDRDATGKAFKYQKEFGIYGRIRVAILDRDLKYESDTRIKEIIDGAVV